ncbi:MAG: DNA-directed RNA polymerase subunit D [DPANN group archaeon]|nr:DNA-directed RNA polymerase subunit D [DPANN group archaeon]
MTLIDKSKNGTKASVRIKGVTYAYVNALRRYMMDEVPTMAIETVEFKQNSSILYDEIVAHRLGLLVLNTDLKSYELPPEGVKDLEDLPAKCRVQMTLKTKGPGMVYASDLKSKDPKIKPIHPKTPIVKLLKDQEVEFVATAILGTAKEHAKWSTGLFIHSFVPKITVNNRSSHFEAFKNKYSSKIFDKNGKIDKNLIIDNDLVDAVDGVNDDIVKVEYDEHAFILRMETWGALSLQDIATTAMDIFNQELDAFDKIVKAL